MWGEQVTDAQDLGWQSKGEDHFRSWFPFFYLVTILYCSDIVWSKDFSAYFSYFYSDLWSGIFFLLPFFFAFSPSFNWEFSFFLLSPFLWLGIFLLFAFSSKGKDWYSHPGSRFKVSWDFGLRLVARLDMIYVRVWFSSRIKGVSHIISMIHMQQWWLGNFMQN